MTPALWILAAFLVASPPSFPAQSVLEEAALRFARAWGAGDGVVVEGMMREEGIRLYVLGEENRSLLPRQARAVLQDFLERHGGGEPELVRTAVAQGDRRQGYADLRLPTRAPGASGPVIFTVFVGFALEGRGWVVAEVRVLS